MARDLPPRRPTTPRNSSTILLGGSCRLVSRRNAPTSLGLSFSPIAESKMARHVSQEGPSSAAPSSRLSSRATRRLVFGCMVLFLQVCFQRQDVFRHPLGPQRRQRAN